MNVLDELAGQVVNCADFAGNRPYTAAASVGVRVLLYNANPGTIAEGGDPLVTKELLAELAGGMSFIRGVYFVMPRGSSSAAAGANYADQCSARVEALGGAAAIALVLHDVEKVPLDFQAGFYARWDVIRYGRPTKYSVEPFQDATQNDYARMLQRNASAGRRLRKVTTQSYYGGMQPIPPRDPIAYLEAHGLSLDDLEPTVDPAGGTQDATARARYMVSALATGTRGATLFELGRVPL